MRRPLILGVILILLIGAGVFVYVRFFGGANPLVSVPNISLPGSENATDTTTSSDEVMGGTEVRPGSQPPRLVQISRGPVVLGSVTTSGPAVGTSTPPLIVSYIERKSGNVFRYNTKTGGASRTSNRTVPGIMSAAWAPDASSAFVQYLSGNNLSTVNTFSLSANGDDGFFMPQNITSLAVSSSSVLSLATGVNGSVASLARLDGSRATTVFTTPLTQLRVAFAGKGKYLAFTKPTQTLLGAAFLVEGTGQFTRVAGPSAGLVALPSPSGAWLLISTAEQGKLNLYLVNVSTRETLPLPLATIADKCVWAPDETSVYCGVPISPSVSATYPDDWYQGAISFTDRIWKVDVQGRFAQLVLDLNKNIARPTDAVSLSLDSKGQYLTFVNKTDGSLWGYSL
jgi:hypothetical protein